MSNCPTEPSPPQNFQRLEFNFKLTGTSRLTISAEHVLFFIFNLLLLAWRKRKETFEILWISMIMKIIQPGLAGPLITAIDTGKWAITALAITNLKDYYLKDLKYEEVACLNVLRSACLADGKTIYEYACFGGHLEIAQQLCVEKISPDNEAKMNECNLQLIAKVQTSDDNVTVLSVTQLLATTMEMMVRRDKHTLASQYYRVRHYYLLFLPASILTAGSAALAFLSSAIAKPSLQKLMVIVVGIIATLSTFIQTLSDQLGLGGKADIHQTASQSLGAILLSLNFAAVDTIKNGATAFGAQQLEIVRKQATSIEGSCSDPIPEFIHTIYDVLINEVEFHLMEAKKFDESISDDIDILQMEMRLVTDITHEVVMYWGWPWVLSKRSVIANVKEKIKKQFMIIADNGATTPGNRNDKNLSLYDAVKMYYTKNKPISPEVKAVSLPL
jgi:hypothetical protein